MTPEERRKITASAAQRALENIAPVLIVDAALEKARKGTDGRERPARNELERISGRRKGE